MDCEAFREAIASEPQGGFDGDEHPDTCAECAAFREEMIALDKQILRALNIPVPELSVPDLPPVGQEENVIAFPKRRAMTRWFALAASLAIAALFGTQFLLKETDYPSLGAEILAHLDHEPRALRVTDREVPERRLANVLKDQVSEMDRQVGLVTYARTCVINGKEIPHLVIQGEQGPVTLLLLADEKIDSAVPLEGESTQGVILPVGDGSIAIIGERGERLDEVERRLANSVKWLET